ncbi:MAG: hypothetical protein ABJP45_08325 [Cyclobacteriaceae bacterium]
MRDRAYMKTISFLFLVAITYSCSTPDAWEDDYPTSLSAQTMDLSMETPEEYKNFEYLIGTWQIQIGDDRFVNMSFDWAQDKLMIKYTSTNPVKKGETPSLEVEGVIAHHGTKEKLVFMSAYLRDVRGASLMNEGYFQFPSENVIERIFTVHYKEGSGIPWTDGQRAPKGGHPVDFKQIWTKVDENTFSGEFFWKKDGKWQPPYQSSSGKKEKWTRII